MDTLCIVDQPNVDDRCRTCLTRITNTAINIFDHDIQNISIVEILHSFTSLTFRENDPHPKVVCQQCFEKLNSFYEFIVQIENIDAQLQEACKEVEQNILSFESDLKKNFPFQEVTVEYNLQGNEGSFIKEELFEDEDGTLGAEATTQLLSGEKVELIGSCMLKLEPEHYLCKLCNKYFSNERNFLRHNKKHLNFTTSHVALNNSNLSKEDKELLTSKEGFICMYCSYSFNTGDALSQHLQVCTSERRYEKYSDLNVFKTDSNSIEANTEVMKEDNIKCHNCSLVFKSQKSLSEHTRKSEICQAFNFKNEHAEDLLKNTVDESLVCTICQVTFKSKYSISVHMRKHVEKGLSCSTSGKVFPKVNHLKTHQSMLHRDSNETTTDCKSIKTKKNISTSSEQRYFCEICNMGFKNKNSMAGHMRKHIQKGRVLSCSSCGKIFNKVSHLKRHQIFVHNDCNEINTLYQTEDTKISTDNEEGEFTCEICQQRFVKKHSMSAHMRKHVEKGRVLSCPTCSKVFSKISHLKRHQVTHEDKRYFKCDVCSKSYSSEELLQQHSKVHTDAKICPVCQKPFSNMLTLNKHIKIVHTRNKLYLCSYCGKRFDSNTNLDQHLKRHLGIKPFACSLCPKKFVCKGDLTSHTVTHTGERPHKCKQCNAVFTKNSSLVKHTNRHLGIKPHHCETCFKKFATKGSLKLHYRIHTGEKPYQCDVCGRAFAQTNDLDKHRRRHLGEKLYKCEQCTESFRLKTELKHHVAQHYVTQLQENNMAAKSDVTKTEAFEEKRDI